MEKNFNTKHEVWRNGKPEIFDNGWDPLKENFQIQTEAGETIALEQWRKIAHRPYKGRRN